MEKNSPEESKDMVTGIVVQARIFSTRLPFKVLYPINGEPIILHILKKCNNLVNITVLAVPDKQTDDILEYYAQSVPDISLYRGSEEDVLDRFYQAAKTFNIDTIIRLTADCPLMNPELILKMLSIFNAGKYDYLSNAHPERTVTKGYDIEIFTFNALKKVWKEAKSDYNREHVTPYFYSSGKFKIGQYLPDKKYNLKDNYSVDTLTDYLRIKNGIECK